MTLNKFHQLRTTVLPNLIKRTAKVLETDMSKDEGLLMEVVDNMDEIVFGDYIRRRSLALSDVVKQGIINGGVDWLGVSKPTGESDLKESLTDRSPSVHAPNTSALGGNARKSQRRCAAFGRKDFGRSDHEYHQSGSALVPADTQVWDGRHAYGKFFDGI